MTGACRRTLNIFQQVADQPFGQRQAVHGFLQRDRRHRSQSRGTASNPFFIGVSKRAISRPCSRDAGRSRHGRRLFYAVSFSSFSPKLSRQWIGLLCALLCVLSAPHCLLCRLLILRIATQPRRQGRPFLRLPASSLLPSAPGACLSLFHAPPFTQSDRMSEKD